MSSTIDPQGQLSILRAIATLGGIVFVEESSFIESLGTGAQLTSRLYKWRHFLPYE